MALVAVLLVLGLLMGLAAALTTVVTMDTGLRGAFARTTTGFYAAESGLNRSMGSLRNQFIAFRVPSGSDFTARTFTLGNRTVTYQLTDPGNNPRIVTIPAGQVFGGLNALQYRYVANSQASSTVGMEAVVGAEYDVGYVPLFQFLAFYANDLEIEPGANMNLHGRIHSNGNLYLNSDATLKVLDNPPTIPMVQVTAKGDVYRGRKDRNSCDGTVTVDTLVDLNQDGSLDARTLACSSGSTRRVPGSELANWKGSMVSRIQSIGVPQPDITAKGAGAYWTNADLRIVLRLDQTDPAWYGAGCPNSGCQLYRIEVQYADGTQDVTRTALLRQFMNDGAFNVSGNSSKRGTRPVFYTDAPCSACDSTQAASYSPAFSQTTRVYSAIMGTLGTFDADYRRGGFYNEREDKWMLLLNVNLHDLLAWNQNQSASNRFFDPGDTTDGGLVIYLTVQGSDSTAINNYGVRLFGSGNLPFPAVPPGGDPTGLTVVSDQAVYVQGDYNATTWQPAAVFGDSINVLSNSYFCPSTATGDPSACATNGTTNDGQSRLALSNSARNATSTIVNTAFLAGVDATTSGNYNGGLENYPRFHESWSGQTLTYLGSFVSLGTPGHVNGSWCGTGNACNIYNPPARNWDYDSRFNDVRNLPPLTPRFVYVQQVLFTQNFQ
ncbi:MAG: hypothetical protein U0587_00385 [Candidatus Binatia bacterium]